MLAINGWNSLANPERMGLQLWMVHSKSETPFSTSSPNHPLFWAKKVTDTKLGIPILQYQWQPCTLLVINGTRIFRQF